MAPRNLETAGGGRMRLRTAPAIDYRSGERTYWAFSKYDRSEGQVERVHDRLAPRCAVWFAPHKSD